MKLQHIIEAKYVSDTRDPQWFRDLRHYIRHNIHEYGDASHDEEQLYRWASDHQTILNKLFADVIKSREDFIREWYELQFDGEEAEEAATNEQRRQVAADLWATGEQYYKFPLFKELRNRWPEEWVDRILNIMVDVASGMRE